MKKRKLGPGQKPDPAGKFNHMMRLDQVTWTMFLQSGKLVFDEVWYDVHVGRPVDVPENSPQWMMNVAMGVTRKRIDVVARKGNMIFLAEVKPHANMEAIGQSLTYRHLFLDEFDVDKKVASIIISQTADSDIMSLALKNGIMIYTMKGIVP